MTTDVPGPDPFEGVDLDDATASFARVLAGGPLRDDVFLAALRADGAWGAAARLADDELADAVEELLPPGIWRTQMAVWFDIDAVLDGRIFTHRLTEAEVAAAAVAVLPDLTLVDWDHDARPLAHVDGDLLADYRTDVPGVGEGTFTAPVGWLAGFAPGDVIGVRLGADGVTIEHVDAAALPDPSSPEVGAITRALRDCFARWSNGNADELGPAALDVLVEVPDAFRSPTLPLSELATAAGLERRGYEYGPADRPWLTSRQRGVRTRADALSAEIPTWVQGSFGAVADAYVEWVGAPAAGLAPAVVTAARTALSDDGIAGLLAEVATASDAGSARLDGFVAALGGHGDDDATASLEYLSALAAVADHHYDAAVDLLRSSIARDAGQLDAVAELGMLLSDRGDAVGAKEQFRRAQGPAAWTEALERLVASTTTTGRNEPCPCGSGRKFKQCCLVAPQAPVEQRGPWYALRLGRHLASTSPLALEAFYSVLDRAIADGIDLDRIAIDDDAIEDLVTTASGTAVDYLDAHDEHLSPVDREALVAWSSARVRVWTARRSGAVWTLTTDDGEQATVPVERADAAKLVAGPVAARVVRLGTVDHVASAIPLDGGSRHELEGLLADDDAVASVTEWAWWYATTVAEEP